jgi:Xaa-Pro aminopeptidase
VVTSKVTAKFETIDRTVLAAPERVIATIRPGVMAREVDAEARSVIEEAGFGRFFRPGLGLEIHEAPGSTRIVT